MTTPRPSVERSGPAENRNHPVVPGQLQRRLTEHSHQPNNAGRKRKVTLADTPPPAAATYGRNIDDLENGDSESSGERPSILPPSRAWKNLFLQEISKDWMLEIQLFFLTISTGVQDATTYYEFNVFTTKMTGNTLFLALFAFSTLESSPLVEQNVGVAIVCYLAGAVFFGHVGREVKQARRSWLVATNLFQTLLVFAATAVRVWAPRKKAGDATLGVVALLSFASSGQIAMAVGVGLAELNTVMITGSLVQLANDKKIFYLKNEPRTRRALFFVSYLVGCFIGAAMIRQYDAWAGLLMTACLKGAISLSFLFNRGWVIEESQSESNNGPISGTATPISRILWGD